MSSEQNLASELVSDIVKHEPPVREEIVSNLQEKGGADASVESGSTGGSGIPEGSGEPRHSNGLFGDQSTNENGTSGTNSRESTTAFDPSIHEVNPDGTPRLTKDGKPRRKRGRKHGGNSNTAGSIPSGSTAVGATVSVDYRQVSTICCNLFFTGTTSFLGKAWEPSPQEIASIHQSTTRVLETYQINDIPPVLGLVLAVGIYAVPRLNDAETKRNIAKYARSLGFRVAGTGESEPTNKDTANPDPAPIRQPSEHNGSIPTDTGNSNVGGNGTATYIGIGGRF